MSEYKVQTDVEIPPNGTGCVGKYPWGEMEVGQSIFFPPIPGRSGKRYAVGSAISYGRRHGMKFVSRKYTQDGIEGLMIWRVK